ncbi:hypothetical protein TrVE_jg12901 [Triparma verrucosa]|uniref:Protein unc-45 homolog B n=1 Tax=Triparma verrucosa TaxID=1606542 RepID=A0A9W7FEH3_9STRA|nr:hypothetical protein TrVE_jg12901 [Triparma verrucosa]
MSDPMAMLDLERRTGVKNSDVDDFVKKTDALQQAISGIVSGELDPAKVSLKKYGILTEQEQAEEDARREKNRKEMAERVAKEKAEEARKEREKWWDGAEYMYGPREGSADWKEEQEDARNQKAKERAKRTEEEQQKLLDRYSLDYNRWNESNYVPDDEASKEEQAYLQKQKEEEDMAKFEATNAEWCNAQKEDIDKRREVRAKKDGQANASRLKGNRYYGQKKYDRALEMYMESLAGTPYKTNVLTNISLCYSKMKKWSDAVEFCDRAIHCDRKCVKALVRRSVNFIEMSKAESEAVKETEEKMKILKEGRVKALKDLEAALLADPENKDVIKHRKDVVQDLADEELELRVKDLVVKEEKRALDSVGEAGAGGGGGGGQEEKKQGEEDGQAQATKQWLERGMEKLAKGEEFGEAPPISEFSVVDSLMAKVADGKICSPMAEVGGEGQGQGQGQEGANLMANLAESFGVDADLNPSNGDILKLSLEESEETRVYLRTSGGLVSLCDRLMKDDETAEAERATLFNVLAAAVEENRKSKDLVYEKMGLAAAVACMYQEMKGEGGGGEETAMTLWENKMGACSLLAACIDDEGGVSAKCTGLVCGDIGLVMSVVKALLWYARFEGEGELASCASALGLLRDMARNEKAKKSIGDVYGGGGADGEHLVLAVVFAMTAKRATPDVREVAVCCLSNLALVEVLRSKFCLKGKLKEGGKSVTAVHGLLAISRAHKTETPASRAVALGCLMNACIGGGAGMGKGILESKRDENGVKKEIASYGGIPVLISLLTSSSNSISPAIIKQRSSGLLGRCLTCEDCVKKLMEEPTGGKICLALIEAINENDGAFFKEGEGSKMSGEMVCNLVRCMAVVKPAPVGSTGYVDALVKLLPVVRGDNLASGRITASSVCMPPEAREEGSTASMVDRDVTLVANCIKALIGCLDVGREGIEAVVDTGGLERLISVLANNSSYKNAAVRKNAAAAIARIVKSDEKAMARCRELRGMEILMELGQSGKI